MNNKKAVAITALITLLLILFWSGYYLLNYWLEDYLEEQYLESLTPYERTLSDHSPPFTWDDIYHSDAAYLVNTDFEITPENIYQYAKDAFSAPSRLYFTNDLETDEPYYKCDKPEINAGFAEIFRDAEIDICPKEEFEYYDKMVGAIGYKKDAPIMMYTISNMIFMCGIIIEKKTYILFSFHGESSTESKCFYFYTDEDLTKSYHRAIQNALPYSMEAKDLENE